MSTELLYLQDAYVQDFDATVEAVEDGRVRLDRTAFYPTGGGQPHDTGTLTWDGGSATVTEVVKQGADAWHVLDGEAPEPGTAVTGAVDWERRHALMRTHTALHILCG